MLKTHATIKAVGKIYFLEIMCYLLMQIMLRAVIRDNKTTGPFDRSDCRKTKTELLMSTMKSTSGTVPAASRVLSLHPHDEQRKWNKWLIHKHPVIHIIK